MNVIEYIRKWVEDNAIEKFAKCHIDGNKSKIGEWDLAPNGITKTKETIDGVEYFAQNFTLYTQKHSYNDLDRLNNSNFLAELGYNMSKIENVSIAENGRGGKIIKVSTNNALLYSVIDGDINKGVTYQIQISVEYLLNTPQPQSI